MLAPRECTAVRSDGHAEEFPALHLISRCFGQLRGAINASGASISQRAKAFATAVLFTGALAAAACTDGGAPTSAVLDGHSLRLGVTPTIQAAPGAVVEALVTYTPSGSSAVTTLGHDSLLISNTLNGATNTLAVTADVGACISNATAAGGKCTVTLTMRLKRDDVLLDESVQQIDISSGTTAISIPAITLFEVSTVQVTAAARTTVIEPGDTAQLAAVALNRSAQVVATARTATWDVVSGGITISASGILTAVSPGAAVARATLGGKTGTLNVTIGPSTVASITVVPVDTLIPVGGTATIRATPFTQYNAALTGRTLTYTSSNPAVASVSTTGVVTGVSVGATTITVRSAEGRGNTVVSQSVPLRVEAAPPVLFDRTSVSLDSLAPGTTSGAVVVNVTTTAGKKVNNLVATTTYTPTATPWLVATLSPSSTPATLTLQASSGALAPGDYTADVRVASTSDPSVPATIRVTLRVVAARRVTLSPKTVDFGAISSSVTSTTPVSVTVSATPTTIPLTGLTSRIEYISTVTGWLTAGLQATTASPTTTLRLTPVPSGQPDGTYQARVIVSSTTFGAAPDTVNVTLTVAPSGRFTGQLLNGTNQQPIAGAAVVIRRASDNVTVDAGTTGTDGRFTSSSLPAGAYTITFTATGFITTTYANEVLTGSVSVPLTTLPSALVAPSTAGSGAITGVVRDATTNLGVAGVTVELRAGGNNTTGAILATVTTNSAGSYEHTVYPAGTYTVRAFKTGYAANVATVTVAGANVNVPVLFISPGTANVVWRFVLSWGASPSDLDAHLTGPLTGSTSRFHVYWSSPGSATASPFAALDIDQINGNGPETITVTQQIAGTYRYYVNNFSLEAALSTSNARVDVYQGNTLVNQFFVPSGAGTVWTVFEINGTVVTPINTMGTVQPSIVSSALRTAPSAIIQPGNALTEWYNLFSTFEVKPQTVKR